MVTMKLTVITFLEWTEVAWKWGILAKMLTTENSSNNLNTALVFDYNYGYMTSDTELCAIKKSVLWTYFTKKKMY